MSKNIVIAEGRRGRRFGAVKKLQTRLQGGGDCPWVPEDDVQLESLYAYENGVYRPEKYGFEDVSVNVVDATLTPMSTVHNSPSFPPAGTDGFSKVTVNVPESEQDTYMDAIQWKCLPMPSDKPYMWVRYYDHSGTSSGTAHYHTRCTVTFQSSFPPFVNYVNGEPALCGFMRGDNSLRITVDWENTNDKPKTSYINHSWLHGCVVECTDRWNGNVMAMGTEGIGSRLYNGEDILDHRYGWPSYMTLVAEGDHYAAAIFHTGTTTFFKQDSTLNTSAGSVMSNVRQANDVASRTSNGWYSNTLLTTEAEYKIVSGKSFATMEEWLTWCKTH